MNEEQPRLSLSYQYGWQGAEVAYHIQHNVVEAVYTQDFVLSLIVIWDEQWWRKHSFQMLVQPGSSDLLQSPWENMFGGRVILPGFPEWKGETILSKVTWC